MRIPGRALLTACTLTLAIGCLTACTSTHTVAQPSSKPSPTPTPIFTSDAEALAAATAVYKKFEEAVDDIGHDGGADPERVKPYVSESGYQFEVSQANKFASEHSHGVGRTVLNNAILQSQEERNGVATVTMYTCEDISGVDRIGPDGKSLVSPNRSNYIAYLVELRSNRSGSLVIQSNKYWSGGGICKF